MDLTQNLKTLIDGLQLLELTESEILAVCLMLETEDKVIKMLLWFKTLKEKPSKKQVLNKARDLCMEDCE
jgi:hypothetical protein